MKNLIIVFISIFVFAISVNAQETKDTTKTKEWWDGLSATFVTGETALTDGNTLFLAWKKGKSVLMADFNAELGEFMYFYYPKPWFSIGPSVGFLWGRPYAGPIGTIEFYKGNFKFNTLNWFGWDFGNALNEFNFLFSFHQFNFGYTFKEKFSIEAYYVLQHFKKNVPEHIPGTKLTFILNETWSAFGGWAYMVHENYHLWSCGITFKL